MKKRFRHDGPPVSCEGWEHSWAAFQGKAYPNPYNGDLDRDQALRDREVELLARQRDSIQERERKRVERHLAKRRREKTGRQT
jgi:hypothetical protein